MCKGGMGSQAAQDMDGSGGGGGGGTAFGTGFDSSNTGEHDLKVSVGTFRPTTSWLHVSHGSCTVALLHASCRVLGIFLRLRPCSAATA